MSRNINALDGLRGFACILVMLSHAGNSGIFLKITFAGQLGVMLFFTLSGFLMGYLYSSGPYSLPVLYAYLIKRFFRVYPAYFFTITLAFLVVLISSLDFYSMEFKDYIKHIILIGKNDVLWTIPVEMRFYLVFPLVIFLLHATKLTKKLQTVLLAVLTIFTLIFDLPGEMYSVWPYIEFFMIGVFIGYVYITFPTGKFAAFSRRWADLGLFFGLIGVIYAIPRFNHFYSTRAEMWASSIWLAPLMALVVLSAAYTSGLLDKIFSHPAARFLGKVSFSLYLLHKRILDFIYPLELPSWFALLLFFGLSVAVAAIVYYAVENPCRKFGNKLAARVAKPKFGAI